MTQLDVELDHLIDQNPMIDSVSKAYPMLRYKSILILVDQVSNPDLEP